MRPQGTLNGKRSLLAVDLGLKTGLALYGGDGRLIWYRSHNFGTTDRLRRAAHRILNENTGVSAIIIEGGGNLADIWEKEAAPSGIPVCRIGADPWREQLLLPREYRGEGHQCHLADGVMKAFRVNLISLRIVF